MIYLDNAATTEPYKEALEAFLKAPWGNPSSDHQIGLSASDELERVRQLIKDYVRCSTGTVIFNSGATEGNNQVINSFNRLITSEIEHPSVLKAKDKEKIIRIPVDEGGILRLDELYKAVNNSYGLVSVQAVNAETGTIQFLEAIGRICEQNDTFFHVDATQAMGFDLINIEEQKIDFLTFSAHKFHGVKGVGCLVARNELALDKLLKGGSQEFGLRAGTQNVPGIVAMGTALEKTRKAAWKHVGVLRTLFETEILNSIPDTEVNGSNMLRVPTITNILFRGCRGEQMVEMLSGKGICVSSGSACSLGEPSYVLQALGRTEEEAGQSLRFSLSEFTTEEELKYTIEKLKETAKYLRGI